MRRAAGILPDIWADLASRAQPATGMQPMTFRVYLRWPNQRVSDKTSTEDRALAQICLLYTSDAADE